jgi:hypothetical protein
MDGMAGHAHHHGRPPSSASLIGAIPVMPYACAHQVGGILAIQKTAQSQAAPATVTLQAFTFQPDADRTILPVTVNIDQSPPGILTLTVQLRV